MLETRQEEIEFIHEHRQSSGLARDFFLMNNIVVQASNSYNNLSLFLSDYKQFYHDQLITRHLFFSTMTDLYLLALITMDDTTYNRLYKEYNKKDEEQL